MSEISLMPAKLPELPYALNALEPIISEEIMNLHYNKHHLTYVNNLNKAITEYQEAEKKHDLQSMIALHSAIKFNGGGHINHSIFWTNLSPIDKDGGKYLEASSLAEAISKQFGSKEKFIEQFSQKAVAIQGSGWAWLGFNKAKNALEIQTCDNQDPLSIKGLIPLLGVDVWEHAYYLQYKNGRADYVKSIWNIVNWKDVSSRYEKVLTS